MCPVVRFPVIEPVPPIFNAPVMPAPPATTNAPVVVLELTVPELATKLPATTSIPSTVSVCLNDAIPVTVRSPCTVCVPLTNGAYPVIAILLSVIPVFDVNEVTNALPDSLQYNATFDTNPLARFIKNPTSTLATVAPACNTVSGSDPVKTLVSSCPIRGLVNAIFYTNP